MSKIIMRIRAGVIAGMLAAIGVVGLMGCKGGEKSVEMGPVETVEAFCKAVSSGQWDVAEELCDSLSMKEYLDNQKQTWARLEKEDERVMKVARSILESTVLTVEDMSKDDDKRVVIYKIEADGLSKTKKATLKKEEGEWRVVSITEAN